MHTEDTRLRQSVMQAIREGKVHMRPRWHFALLSALTLVGAGIIFLTLLYAASLALFFLRDSGAWYAPSLGFRGWGELLSSLPWILIVLIAAFFVILELLVRRYSFVYRKPLLLSLGAVLLIIFGGGFVIAPFHHHFDDLARRGYLPSPLSALYGHPVRAAQPHDMYHGQIVAMTPNGFLLFDEEEAATTSIIITPQTHLPYGADFTIGERVLVVGDAEGTSTMHAFGVREIDEYPDTD